VPADVRAEQEKIERADAMAFIYPVWWSDCPAVLKGWFDRVLTYGYAYYYDDAEERHTEITIEKAVVICSAGHTEEHLEETGIAEAMRRIMLHDRLLGIGVKSAAMEILGGMMPGDDTWRDRNLKRAYDAGRNLQSGAHRAPTPDRI
jgi:NAD(P)H dehydrogenase (quinone)